MEYPPKQEMESTMQTTIQLQTEGILDNDALVLASLILVDVSRIIRDIQAMVAVLLRFAIIGISLANSLIGLFGPTVFEEN
jgi:hypothetical protein